MEGETAIAASALALGPRQGVFLTGLRVQEHREVGAHRAEPLFLHLLGRGPDHHPVDFADRASQQAVAHCAAHFVNLHACSSVAAQHNGWRG
ncbi:hypothetical protein D3C72_1967310 [compost metagenome]